MTTSGFDARGAAVALKAAITRGDVDVSSLYGGTPGGPRIPCPIHNGDSSSFEIYEDGRWRCHSRCGSGGDVFNFVAIRELGAIAGEPLRGAVFADAVRLTFELLGVDGEAYACARSPVGRGGKKSKPFPPAGEVAQLLAFAHELPVTGETFAIGGRARPGIGTYATAAGLALCVVLGADTKKHRPKWATRWPAGMLFPLYDDRGALATVHLRPDDESKGKGKNPPRFNPCAFLMNEPMRALLRGESRDERDRARLLGYETARQRARDGVLLTEGPPAWGAWSRWHPAPVGAVTGQDPSRAWMQRLPRDVPILLDFDPDLVGLKYTAEALRGLARHDDVRVSARTRWIIDRADEAKRNPDALALALEEARKADPRLLDPDELVDGPRIETAGFEPLSPEERVDLMGQGSAFGAKWAQELRTNEEGKIVASEGNLILALKTDERWAGVIGRNERSDEITLLRRPPVEDLAKGHYPREFRDEDASHVGAWYESELSLEFKNAAIHRAMSAVASLHPFDRVREYLGRVGNAWDETPRLDKWLVDYLGADDTPLNRATGAKWMISAVARTFKPGCKADYVLVFEGSQGAKKSSAFAALCPDSSLFTDAMPDLQREKAVAEIVTSGVWICELPELDSTARADVSAVKAFLTRREEKFRPAYGRSIRTQPRRVVFGASTNEGAYLRDQTGNRRFWPVGVRNTDLARLVADRDQLWGEAVTRYRQGEVWYLDDPALEQEAAAEQESRREVDPWEPPVVAHLETWRDTATRLTRAGSRCRIPTLPGDCMETLDLSTASTTVRDARRINAILRHLGWERVQRRDGPNKRRRWAWEPSPKWLFRGVSGVSPGDTGLDDGNLVTENASDSAHVTSVTNVTRGALDGMEGNGIREPIVTSPLEALARASHQGTSGDTGIEDSVDDFDDEWSDAKLASEEALRW